MKYVLLSIRNRWAEAILSGEKKYEYRRTPPSMDTPYIVIMYVTAPHKEVVGMFTVKSTVEGAPEEITLKTIDETPHTKPEILDYLEDATNPSALEVSEPERFHSKASYSELQESGATPSQNFRYVTDENLPEKITEQLYPKKTQV